ncbi:hypothetical protein JCM10207_009164 [Rhodosporidiobolus poonsookiae]
MTSYLSASHPWSSPSAHCPIAAHHPPSPKTADHRSPIAKSAYYTALARQQSLKHHYSVYAPPASFAYPFPSSATASPSPFFYRAPPPSPPPQAPYSHPCTSSQLCAAPARIPSPCPFYTFPPSQPAGLPLPFSAPPAFVPPHPTAPASTPDFDFDLDEDSLRRQLLATLKPGDFSGDMDEWENGGAEMEEEEEDAMEDVEEALARWKV